MVARNAHESHRVATPLELLVDLCFVVAIAQAAAHLHHGIASNHIGQALIAYVMVFFAIWWAWMNFTWFASGYDTDDAPYRLKVLVQIVGSLMIAAGVPRAFEHQDFSLVTIGYAVMRVGLVAQWVRVAISDASHRRVALRSIVGLVAVQGGWLAMLLLPKQLWLVAWGFMVCAELAVPLWASRAAPMAWHPHHIAERYGLLTLIVLGESVLAATVAIQTVVDGGHFTWHLGGMILGAILTMFSMWWIYFDRPSQHILKSEQVAFLWGYGHFFVFATIAAMGAGFSAALDFSTGHAAMAPSLAGAVFAVPVAIFIGMVWALMVRPLHCGARSAVVFLGAAALVLAASIVSNTEIAVGLIMAALAAYSTTLRSDAEAH